MITQEQLNALSVAEILKVSKMLREAYRLKTRVEAVINSQNLSVGMTARYVGAKDRIKDETFTIEKINTVNASCVSNKTGIRWNIKIANLQPV